MNKLILKAVNYLKLLKQSSSISKLPVLFRTSCLVHLAYHAHKSGRITSIIIVEPGSGLIQELQKYTVFRNYF